MNETNEKEPYDLEKEESNIKEAEKELEILQNELQYQEVKEAYDEGAEFAISCCQRISMSVNTGSMSTQEIINDKVLIDSVIRKFEGDIETHGNHNRHWLVRHIQKKVDSIMEAKHVWRI